MRFGSRYQELALGFVGFACLVFSAGCRDSDDNGTKSATAKYYQQQAQVTAQQNAAWEQQLEEAEAQSKKAAANMAKYEQQLEKVDAQFARYDAILAKMEEQGRRTDALLDRWERIAAAMEKRSGDQ